MQNVELIEKSHCRERGFGCFKMRKPQRRQDNWETNTRGRIRLLMNINFPKTKTNTHTHTYISVVRRKFLIDEYRKGISTMGFAVAARKRDKYQTHFRTVTPAHL